MTGMEPLAISVVSGVAVPIFQSLLTGGGKVMGMVGQNLERGIFTASNKYEQNYKKRHGILRLLGMNEGVKLESVYTAVQFLDNDQRDNFQSIDNLQKVYRQANIRRFQSQDKGKQEGILVANDKQYLMVLGAPGVGKSTFLRKMGLEALKGKKGAFKHHCIPVFIALQDLKSTKINLENLITEEFRICGFPQSNEFTAKALEQGKLLILLDGLDEVPKQNLTEAISQIQNFVDKYDKNRFIASSRMTTYSSSFRRFSDVAMADFDDTQIQQFIYNWFYCEADKQGQKSQKCWELLQKPENKAAKELSHTPLLLTFLCLVYDRSQRFPDNRSVLYRKALRIFLEEWASSKGINQPEIYQGLHTELEEILLSEIAYINFESDKLFFSERDVVQQIKTFLANNLNAPQHLDGESVLNAIAIQQGILVERAEDVFSFSHLTLQEYLTAQYIDDHRQVEKLVTQHLTDERWREVFLLVAGLMRGGADDLLLAMEKEAQNYITPQLQALLNWAEQITAGSTGDFKPVAKRALAVAYASNAISTANGQDLFITNAITKAITITYGITNPYAANTYAYANGIGYVYANPEKYIPELEEFKIFNNVNFTMLIDELKELKDKIPDRKQPDEMHRIYIQRLQQTLLNAFNLTPDIINLSDSESKVLNNYLHANYLIIQCKQAAVRVSPTTWEAIEAGMLIGNK